MKGEGFSRAAVEDRGIRVDHDRPAHVVAVLGTQDDPVRLTLCGKTLTDSRHFGSIHGRCVVCASIRDDLVARGLR